MTYGSRLSDRSKTKTITVYQRSSVGVETAVSTDLTNITVTHHQKTVREFVADFGQFVSRVIDIFWFYPIDGSLPAITEKYLIYEDGDTTNKYEVTSAVDQGGQGEVLMVETDRTRL